MTRKPAVAVALAAPTRNPRTEEPGPVAALRARLAGRKAREHAVLDFLEEDLRETRAALETVVAYVASVESALADEGLSRQRILALARGGRPPDCLDQLSHAVGNVRRWLAQLAVRM